MRTESFTSFVVNTLLMTVSLRPTSNQVSCKVNKPRPVVGANGEECMEDGSEAAAGQNQYALHREQRLKINGRKKTVSQLMIYILLLMIDMDAEVRRLQDRNCGVA